MNHFWGLTGYEYKKLLKKRMVWITLAILCAGAVYAVLYPFFSMSVSSGETTYTYAEIQENDRNTANDFNGKKIDGSMMKELDSRDQSADRDVPDDMRVFAISIGSNGAINYQEDRIFDFKEDIYGIRDQVLENRWEAGHLSEGEIKELRKKNENLKTPFTYHYAAGYKNIINLADIIAIMQTLFIAICIPLIFSEEHNRKTAQTSLCTKYGKNVLFGAKIFTGISFSVITTIALFLCILIPAAACYGTEGIHTQVQVFYPFLSWDLNMGEMLLVLLGLWIAAAVLQSAFVMFLAEKCRNNTVPMAVMVGVLIFTSFFNIPAQHKILAQIWAYVPVNMMRLPDAFGDMMISVFGKYYGVWQSAPLFYLILSATAVFAGSRVYRGFQVKEK